MLSCARCRLRGMIKTLEAGRRTSGYTLAPLRPTMMRTSRTTSMMNGSPRRAGFASASAKGLRSPRDDHAASPGDEGSSASALSQRQQVLLIEGLYTSGQISRDEWRDSVFVQAGLAESEASVDEQVRKLREWFSGLEVPGILLDEEQRVVYERLFGTAREVELDTEEEGEGLDGLQGEDKSGPVVLRQKGDGSLEEVKFDDDAENENLPKGRMRKANDILADDMRAAMRQEESEDLEGDRDEPTQRTHPLTFQNRFTTSPVTLEMPRAAFTDPITTMLSNISNTHISESAHKIFGGAGLPYSTSTPARGRQMPQKPITLDAGQGRMSKIEADVFMSTLMPGMFSSVMSVLIETRKRLGTEWAEGLVRKAEAGTLRILDAGAGGAGILAVREMLRAEWERMHEDAHKGQPLMAPTKADGRVGGESLSAPLGSATVLTGSDTLRYRASQLLENTTFIPRLPDYLHTEEAKKKGKFDIVIAPHGLWQLREDPIRKFHVQNLWSLLSINGGVLLLLEKGVARGFELVAGARDMLLEHHIASPDSTERVSSVDRAGVETDPSPIPKETGMIVAPCTNHTSCPMYAQKGKVLGRRDICAFSQRYHRPAFLQNIFGASGRNHEDVEFSYLSVMRGKDLRPEQSAETTDRAFAGYEKTDQAHAPASLSLPRNVYPPLKRQGHVTLDVCTSAGKLERWTVPKSFSKRAYRDARKASWGDLWALGAKTRTPRNPVVKKNRLDPAYGDLDVKPRKGARKQSHPPKELEGLTSDEFGRVTFADDVNGDKHAGRTRGHLVKGVRDKRDKRGDGNGRKARASGFD